MKYSCIKGILSLDHIQAQLNHILIFHLNAVE